jgi:sphingomyelin phosphodiesterase
MFHFVKNMEDGPDLVLWTGDNVSHDIWNQTVHKNTEATILITEFIKTHWPEIPVFVSPGNHEFFPVNVEGFDEKDQPILNLLAEHWKDWIDEDSLDQFRKYGYYHIKLRDLNEKFDNVRVITINTQAGNDLNWDLLTTLNDPGNQLSWLEAQLKEIEAEGDVVYIIGHIPPNDALNEWSIRYKTLVERFQHIIRFQGFGHTHDESFYVVRGAYDYKPVSEYHLAGSVTTFTGKNPSFRMMDVDKETMLPIRMHTYFLNMTRANFEGKPTWEHRYEFTEEYEMEDLSPSSIYEYTDKIQHNPDLAVKYLKNRYGQGGPGTVHTTCDYSCQWNLKCEIISANKELNAQCVGNPYPDYYNDLMSLNFNEYFFDPWIQGPQPQV